jgi:hypothetical protein
VDIASLIGPRAGSFEPPNKPASGKTSVADAGAATKSRPYSFTIRSGDLRDEILLGDRGKEFNSTSLTARCSMAFARFIEQGEEIADCGLRI